MIKNFTLNIITLLLITNLIYSQDGYQTNISIEGNYGAARKITASVIDDNIKILSIRKKLTPHYSIPKAIALNNGNLVLLHSLEGKLEIFNGSSSPIFEKDFFTLSPYNEQVIKQKAYANGIAIIVCEEQKNNLYLISNSGKIVSESKLEDGLITGLASSPLADQIAYSIINWDLDIPNPKTLIHNMENDTSIEFKLNFENGIFSENENLFLGNTNRSAFCIDLIGNNILWDKKLSEDEIYLDQKFQGEKVILVKSESPKFKNNNWVYKNASVVQKDNSGNEDVLQEITKEFIELKLNKSRGQNLIEVDGDILEYNISAN